jgi:hypothetical protein
MRSLFRLGLSGLIAAGVETVQPPSDRRFRAVGPGLGGYEPSRGWGEIWQDFLAAAARQAEARGVEGFGRGRASAQGRQRSDYGTAREAVPRAADSGYRAADLEYFRNRGADADRAYQGYRGREWEQLERRIGDGGLPDSPYAGALDAPPPYDHRLPLYTESGVGDAAQAPGQQRAAAEVGVEDHESSSGLEAAEQGLAAEAPPAYGRPSPTGSTERSASDPDGLAARQELRRAAVAQRLEVERSERDDQSGIGR